MTGLLLDVNVSHETSQFLTQTFGFDAIRLTGEQTALTDAEVVALARVQARVIVTFDLDFGEIYYLRDRGQIGVIILRLANQTVESVNRSLAAIFRSEPARETNLETSLVVLTADRARIVRAAGS